MRIVDVDLRNQRIIIRGDRQRTINVSKRVVNALGRYLDIRREAMEQHPFFVSNENHYLSRQWLDAHILAIGDCAGVPNAHPHRFRHTFAINFLQKGGNFFVLGELLGVRIDDLDDYLRLASGPLEVESKK